MLLEQHEKTYAHAFALEAQGLRAGNALIWVTRTQRECVESFVSPPPSRGSSISCQDWARLLRIGSQGNGDAGCAVMEKSEENGVNGEKEYMDCGQYWMELMRLSLEHHVDTSHLVPYSLPRHVEEQERLVRSDGWIRRIDPTVLSCLKRYLERCRELGTGPAGCFLQHPASATLNLAGTRLD